MALFKEDGRREGRKEGLEEGLKEGLKEGMIRGSITILRDLNMSEDSIMEKIMEKYQLTREEVKKYL